MVKKTGNSGLMTMPTEEGLIQAAITLIVTLRAKYGWTWADLEDAQELAGFGKDVRMSAQMLRLFHRGQTEPDYLGTQIPSPARLEVLLKAFRGRVIISMPDYSEIGKPDEYKAILRKK